MKKLICLLLMILLIGCRQSRIFNESILYYIISMEENTIVLYPGFYEQERHEEQEKAFIEMTIADNIEYYDTLINTKIYDDGKEESTEITKKITKDDLLEAIEYDSAFVYVECDNENKISKLTLYGELIVYE